MSYFDIKAVSSSSLSYIDSESGGSPRLFIKFLNGELDEKPSKSFETGTLIHEELLEPGKLDIVPADTPGPKTQEIIDALWNRLYGDIPLNEECILMQLADLQDETWEAVIPPDFYPKYALHTKINRIVKEGGMYWNALHSTRGKKIVDPATYHVVQGCIESIKMHPVATQLILERGYNAFDETKEELEIQFETEVIGDAGIPVTIPIKAKIDRILISHEHKAITLVDLKTTAKPIGRFDETLSMYKYYRQLAWYKWCLEEAYPDYTVSEVYIVAVQTNKEYPSDVFKIDDTWLRVGSKEIDDLLGRIAFHMSNNNWGNSMEIQNGCIHSLVYNGPEDI